MKLIEYKNYLVKWLIEEVEKANMDGVVVGISGGVDSSVVASIAQEAFGENALGIYLPIGNMGQDLIDAKQVVNKINIRTRLIDLTKTYEIIRESIGVNDKMAKANIKPRLRMTSLYAVAQEKKYLVLGTDNAAEWVLGYFTKYGDGGVDLLPIIHLTKQEVKDLAKLMGLPEIIYTKKPTAGLWENQTDEEELGFSYDDVDKYLTNMVVDNSIKKKIEHQIMITNHKRVNLPTPKKFRKLIAIL